MDEEESDVDIWTSWNREGDEVTAYSGNADSSARRLVSCGFSIVTTKQLAYDFSVDESVWNVIAASSATSTVCKSPCVIALQTLSELSKLRDVIANES
jgi:hypothetical protein